MEITPRVLEVRIESCEKLIKFARENVRKKIDEVYQLAYIKQLQGRIKEYRNQIDELEVETNTKKKKGKKVINAYL